MLRRLLALVLLLAIAVPLLLPYAWSLANPAAWKVWSESWRLGELFANSAALAGITCLFAVPLGILCASGLLTPTRRPTALLFALGLAIPLPILTIAGAIFGSSGAGPWNPFASGLLAAAFVHIWAAVPWVVWIVGPALLFTDPV